MLSRFRMTVDDCIAEYERLGDEIFGNPRPLHSLTVVFKVAKYNSRKFEDSIRTVTNSRCEDSELIVRYPFDEFLSKTSVLARFAHWRRCLPCLRLVLAFKKDERTTNRVEIPYLIRSYDHYERRYNTSPLLPKTSLRNYGPAHNFEIWEVARATTAAPPYFDPLKISALNRSNSNQSSSHQHRMIFTDGGFGQSNNPTLESFREVLRKNAARIDRVGIVVSIGTGGAVVSRYKSRGCTQSDAS
jgi:hypothetical protein